MEKSTPIGIVTGLLLVFGVIFLGEGWQTFFDIGSMILVVGGTIAALLVSYNLAQMKTVPAGIKSFFSFEPPNLGKYVTDFAEFARIARREGLLALDRRIGETDDEFMRYGLEMAIDGIDENEIDDLLKARMASENRDRSFMARFFTTAGTYAPAFGMVGTLIGLIQMLQNLTDPSQIGKGMAVALITTFYGALLANLLFLPFAGKMKMQATEVMLARELVRTGIIPIVRGESPSMIEKRLSVFVKDGKTDADTGDSAPLSRAA
ncbi:MAG: motility protein A [Bacteroidota bacterium]